MSNCFENVKMSFGFGCMRLPMKGDEVDAAQVNQMVDAFLAAGFNYFDTAHGYLGGKSETALRECLVARHPRESYVLTDKLTGDYFDRAEDVLPLFESQLAACGVTYFDFYLMHAQSDALYAKFQRCKAYDTARELKRQGKIKHFGLSFHDKAEVLDRILTENPDIEAVQIQFNYADYDDPSVESGRCYDVCVKHGKPVIVMEPVKGGHLVNLPAEARALLDGLQGGSSASYALRYAAGFENVQMVLSGMSDMAQMLDNIGCMKDFQPLTPQELAAVDQVRALLKAQNLIPCTACRYCTAGCPKQISIPDLFACLNAKRVFHDWNADYYYHQVHTAHNGKASDCIRCGKCELACPQHLSIRALLADVAEAFEKK